MGIRTTDSGRTRDNETIRKVNKDGAPTTGESHRGTKDTTTGVVNMSDLTITYDTARLNTFIQTVFPEDHAGSIFTQASPTAPRGYGISPAKLLEKLDGCKVPMPCYFGTSTVDDLDDALRFKRDRFQAMFVVVLDDIGTKIPLEKVKHIEPTYIIETSKGNFQWGLVLDEPITDYEEAALLLSYLKGITDEGGLMPCKKVRLPCGVNTKKSANMFHVELITMDGPVWTPQAILRAAGVEVLWEDIRKHAATGRERAKKYGASAWAKVINKSPSGVIDPLLEWLYESDFVVADSDPEWIEIICPWYEDHTTGENTAGYSPMGRGSSPDTRGFKCFHGHCTGRKTDEFLIAVGELGGPLVPRRDPFPEWSSSYVLDMANDMAWNVQDDKGVWGVKTEMLKKTTPAAFIARDGKAPARVNPVSAWMTTPHVVRVHGVTYDPADRSPIVRDESNRKMVNTFKLPDYALIKPDMDKVNPFKQFLEYLIPEKTEREYFLDWLACKVQNPSFRGAGMIMVAQNEGTGRNTMMQMIGKLFGQYNVEGISMENLMHSQWTDWRANLFVHVDESLATDDPKTARRAYDQLKELVDPMTSTAMVNPKGGARMRVKLATSMLFFSNHENALHVAENTRRFYGIRNPDKAAGAEYFASLRKWMGDFDKATGWENHVWCWLQAREVDLEAMSGAPAKSKTMKDIIKASKSEFEILVEGALACWDCDLVPVVMLMDAISTLETRGLHQAYRNIIPKIMRGKLYSLAALASGGARIRPAGKQPVTVSGKVPSEDFGDIHMMKYMEDSAVCKAMMDDFNRNDFARRILEWAQNHDYDLF